ncbi:hypothetical protein NUW54_g14434 [Trametes sanguinea]|uniref:Uncharacterized protein n=1 Tax=Trametes sanguinea TaxID=158606 RepID=A0ACC1MD90_9APHY|nr:hypothetical protein NUW54_g14434 [Trametes sanguinea]
MAGGDGKYAQWMLKNAGTTYPEDAQFLWNQPFSDSGLVKAAVGNNSKSGSKNNNGTSGTDPSVGTVPDNGAVATSGSWTVFAAAGIAALSLFLS